MRHHAVTLLGALLCTAALLLGTGCGVLRPDAPAPAVAPAASAPSPTRPAQSPAPRPTAEAPAIPDAETPDTEDPDAGTTPEKPRGRPVVAGWSVVRSTQRAALYDVPPDWTVNSEDTITGFGTRSGQLLVAGSGSASVGRNACGQYTSLATSVVKHSTRTDLATAARLEAERWAGAAFLDSEDHRPSLRTDPPERITTATGRAAVVVKVTATIAGPGGNCGPEGVAYAVSSTGFTGRLGPTAILVVVAGNRFPAAVPEARIRRILTTLRPER